MADGLNTHRRRLRRLGAGRRAFQRHGPNAAQEARADGMSVTEISRLLNMTRAGVLDLIRRASVIALLALAVTPLLPSTAKATIIDSPNPAFQRWTDESLVPTPPGEVQVLFDTNRVYATLPRTIHWYDASGWEDWPMAQGLFLHELGHVFDATVMTRRHRCAFVHDVLRKYRHIRCGWILWSSPMKEQFAMAYSFAAMGLDGSTPENWGYDYNPSPERQQRAVALIWEAAQSGSQPPNQSQVTSR